MGEGGAEARDDQLLGHLVDLGHDVVLGLVDYPLEALVTLHLETPSPSRGFDGHGQLVVMSA